MRKFVIMVAIIGLNVVASLGQEVGLRISTPNTVYLTGEPIVAGLRLHNRTTRPFMPRGDDPTVQFTIRVTRSGDRTSLEALDGRDCHVSDIDLLPGAAWEGSFEVSRYFAMRAPGHYLLRLIVAHDGMRYESTPRAIEVVPGFELTKVVQVFPGNPPVQRQLRLAYWVRNQLEELFLQVSETPETRKWRTYCLGALIRTTSPKIDISEEGMLTIVHRASPDVFLKTQVQSTATEIVYQGQERLIDPAASASNRMGPFHAMAVEDALKKREEEGKKRRWWPFGAKSEQAK